MKYYSVTFTSAYENASAYQPRTAVFSSKKKAEAFRDAVMKMQRERGQDYIVATIDSGLIDDEYYMGFFDDEF